MIKLGLFALACVALIVVAIVLIILHPWLVAGLLGLLGLLWCVGRAIEALIGRAP